MSQRQQYYLITTKQMFTSKFIYQKAKNIYKMDKGSIISDVSKISKAANIKNTLIVFSMARKKPATLNSAKIPGEFFTQAKRVSVLKSYFFIQALHNWMSALDYSTKFPKKVSSITSKFITLTNRQTILENKIRFVSLERTQRTLSYGNKLTKTSVSFALKKGSLFSKVFFINFFKFIKR